MPKLVLPFLKGVEYISVTKNNKSVLEIDGKDVEGISWREFQLYLGDHLPPGKYHFTYKLKNSNDVKSALIRATSKDIKPIIEDKNNMEDQTKVLKLFESLKSSIDKGINQGGISFDMLLQATKQGYEARIDYLNQKINDKDILISEIKKEIDELEDDLNDCEKENAKHGGIAQYLAIGEKVLNMKFGKQPTVNLKDSNTSDIPKQILDVLGVIDWQKIDEASIKKISDNIAQYLSLIPKEYFKGA